MLGVCLITFERGNPYGQQNIFVASKTHATSTSIIVQIFSSKLVPKKLTNYLYQSMDIVFRHKGILILLQYIQKAI